MVIDDDSESEFPINTTLLPLALFCFLLPLDIKQLNFEIALQIIYLSSNCFINIILV